MKTFVLYMYRLIDKYKVVDDENMFRLSHSPLVAVIESDDPYALTRKQKIEKYNLQPFEIQQQLYDYTIRSSDKFGIRIISIELNSPVDDELEEELRQEIKGKHYKEVSNIIADIRNEGVDIKALTFVYQDREFRVTRFGIIEVDANYSELHDIAMNSPIALITGLKKTLV
ncbi:hypothetical protein [Bacillus cereus]|uniref:hypothetical protein n=1 Tax=Bacillus cereus TaxID=1396 RepID=UPI000B4C1B6D|nr:hypothetical protein [Bacillus cereus]